MVRRRVGSTFLKARVGFVGCLPRQRLISNRVLDADVGGRRPRIEAAMAWNDRLLSTLCSVILGMVGKALLGGRDSSSAIFRHPVRDSQPGLRFCGAGFQVLPRIRGYRCRPRDCR